MRLIEHNAIGGKICTLCDKRVEGVMKPRLCKKLAKEKDCIQKRSFKASFVLDHYPAI